MRGGRWLGWAVCAMAAACGARGGTGPAPAADASRMAAADSACAAADTLADEDADVLVRATVRARTLRHAEAPRASVAFPDSAPGTLSCTVRTNLPRPVQPGRTYRDVEVRLLVRARVDTAAAPADTGARRPPR